MKLQKPDFGALALRYEEKKEKFDKFYALLRNYNACFNLTTIIEENDVFVKHFLDSLAGAELFSKEENVAEVGSGAGFPSVPLMLVREDLHFTLIESTGKKCEFLKTVVKELSLNAEVMCARAEDVGKDKKTREHFDSCCARAVANLNTLSEYCLPLVKVGGKMIAYKGAEEELSKAKNAVFLLGGGKAESVFYELPQSYGTRSLIVVQKTRRTPSAYPRGNGKERSKPLV